jgi:hypothetical protein
MQAAREALMLLRWRMRGLVLSLGRSRSKERLAAMEEWSSQLAAGGGRKRGIGWGEEMRLLVSMGGGAEQLGKGAHSHGERWS